MSRYFGSAGRNKEMLFLDRDTRSAIIDGLGASGTIVSALEDILTELQIKADPTEDQYSLVRFLLDGTETTVTEDTVTPANNAPLPVKLTSASGDINITAGDLNVQLSHTGANYDSTRIGDGTNLLAIDSSGRIETSSALPFFDASGDNTAQVLKASPGRLCKFIVVNQTVARAFVQLFDAAAGSVTVGVTTPDYVIPVLAGDGTVDGGTIDDYVDNLEFSTAITYACTTTATGAGNPATPLMISATYK